ncbi:hypothetical protein TYRP_015298 [Tyrophagus putrescentiae]|nr:hypothetical protein TYRP_015298 [Tyrophagus putrescentiae]
MLTNGSKTCANQINNEIVGGEGDGHLGAALEHAHQTAAVEGGHALFLVHLDDAVHRTGVLARLKTLQSSFDRVDGRIDQNRGGPGGHAEDGPLHSFSDSKTAKRTAWFDACFTTVAVTPLYIAPRPRSRTISLTPETRPRYLGVSLRRSLMNFTLVDSMGMTATRASMTPAPMPHSSF